MKELLSGFKYRGKLHLGKVLSELFTTALPGDLSYFDLVMPVPIHKNKLREREYNQSAVFGKRLSKITNCEYDPFTLRNTKDTPPQILYENLVERKRNVKGFFYVSNINDVIDKSVLLVDDVFTTGSTVNECSKVLLNAGAASVQVLTLLRANT